ncbi:ATP-binding protein [Ferrovibrio sp.]|uniref:PAS domain-containing sensor histidine kinase n=1 Tax=Ferrovibrio sp. TaxID=1917215 RepID=UPI0025BA3B3F|nr:ATP-binding protein [Ferrovibrio sp.]MBX3456339.1 PAS domain-containing protein [Ferrovibrio sp.]
MAGAAPTNETQLNCAQAAQADMLDFVHESILMRTPDGRITHWSQGSQALYGWPKENAVGALVDDLLSSTYPLPIAEIEKQLNRNEKWEGEIRRVIARGESLVVYTRWALQRDAAGLPARIVESAFAVGSVGQAEALRASEYRYRNLFQAMAASFWEIDFTPVGAMLRELRAEGVTDFAAYFRKHPEFVREMMRVSRIIDVNDQTVALFADGDRSKMNLPLDAFWPDESIHVYAESVLAAISRQPNYSTETKLRKTNGEIFDGLFTACFPLESIAKGTLLVGVIDISERKRAFAELGRSEARYRNLFNSMGITCYQLDISGVIRIYARLKAEGVTDIAEHIHKNPGLITEAMQATIVTDVNEPGIAFVGAKDYAEVLGPVSRFWPADDPEGFRQAFIAGYKSDARFETETSQQTLDGRRLDVLFTFVSPPAMREAGLALVSLIDISERKNAQKALEKLQNEFAHASRISMLGELTASLAHEVNQPLAAISANGAAGLRWLDRPNPDTAEVTTLMRRMAADAQRAAEIISRIRLMASPQTPEKAVISIGSLLQEALLFLRHEMQARGVSVTTELESDLPGVLGDRTQLQQVVVNLAMNAIQAITSTQTPHRLIKVSCTLPDDRGIQVSVDDSGPGVAENQRARLFDSFYTTKPDGMGMGLPICRSIIEHHGGTIWVEDGSLGGARFCFSLPPASAGITSGNHT